MKNSLIVLMLFCSQLIVAQKDVSILSYGANSFSSNNSNAIQEAIDDVSLSGGGKVTIPPGTYTTGTIILKSNVELNFAVGSVLLGVLDLEAYPVIKNQTFNSLIDKTCERSLIYAEAAHNIKITGNGLINGNGAFPPFLDADSQDRPFGIRLVSCRNVQLIGNTFMNSGFWMEHILNCDSVYQENVTIINHGNANNDGINADCSRNVIIKNCDVDSSDDGIAIKSTGDVFCEDILVEDCTLKTLSRGVKVGTESYGGFRNITIRDCNLDASVLSNPLFLPGQTGFSINSADGAVLDGLHFENLSVRGYKTAFLLRLGSRGMNTDSLPSKPVGVYRNVTFKNIEMTTNSGIPSVISGLPGHNIEDILFEDITIIYRGKAINDEISPDSIPENPGSKPAFDMFGTTFPCYGFFIRHAKNIQFNNVCMTSYLIPDSRPAFTLLDTQGIEIDEQDGGFNETCFQSLSTSIAENSSTTTSYILTPNSIKVDEPSSVEIYALNGQLLFAGIVNSEAIFEYALPNFVLVKIIKDDVVTMNKHIFIN